jgi:hypothetical protein
MTRSQSMAAIRTDGVLRSDGERAESARSTALTRPGVGRKQRIPLRAGRRRQR